MFMKGIPRSETVCWNIIPWRNGTIKIKQSEFHDGVVHAKELISLLTRVSAVVLVGGRAKRAVHYAVTSDVYSEKVQGSNDEYEIRLAGAHDGYLVALQRASMFRNMGSVSAEESELLRKASEPWLSSLLTKGDYIGWLVEYRRIVVAGGGIFVRELGPVPGCYRVGRWGHIANLYTEPGHRRRGLARLLMKTMLDWCIAHHIDHVTLAASDEGRPLYESLGFKPASEMSLSK
jgi:GNAT superfamily N-acetyltransferase